MLRPTSVSELCDLVSDARDSGARLRLCGGGSKDAIGAPTPEATILDMKGFAGVVDYDPPELVLTVGAGTPLAEVQTLVAAEGQMLAFDPFDYGPMLGIKEGRSTIGGVIAAGVSGPGRLSGGAARDHLLGFEAVSGRGERFIAGAKVVKNVTGYDLSKLVTGSWGRLVALTQLSLKVLPAPRERQTYVRYGLTPHEAVVRMGEALGSAAEVSAAAYLPDWHGAPVTALRLDGFPPSIAARAAMLPDFEALSDSDGLWNEIRFASPLPGDKPLWRVIVPASRAPQVVSGLPDAEWLFDWAGGLVWLASADDPRPVAQALGGHAMLVRATEAMRVSTPTLHPQAPALAALETRVRRSFDPDSLFETGRF